MTTQANPGPPAPARPDKSLSDRVRSLRLGGDKQAGGGASRRGLLPWAFVAVLSLVCVAFGYRAYRVGGVPRAADDSETPREVAKKSPSYTPDAADTTPAGTVVLQQKGYVIPISLIQVSPKVGGQLVKIDERFEEGAVFKKGEVLAWIEDVDYKADYDQTRAAYLAARERFDEIETTMPLEIKKAEADLKEMRHNLGSQQQPRFDRAKRLYASNTIPREEYESAKASFDAMRSRIDGLEASVEMMSKGREGRRQRAAKAEADQAKATMEKAKIRYDWTRITAPVTGTILSKKAVEGNIVNPSAFSSGISASLCDMADLTKLEVDLSIQERDVAQIEAGMPCLIMPEAYQSDKRFLESHPRGYEGVVSRLMPLADRAKGAVPVRVLIKDIKPEEAGRFLRPEMSALVTFLKK